jgi:hypothetical protein
MRYIANLIQKYIKAAGDYLIQSIKPKIQNNKCQINLLFDWDCKQRGWEREYWCENCKSRYLEQ